MPNLYNDKTALSNDQADEQNIAGNSMKEKQANQYNLCIII